MKIAKAILFLSLCFLLLCCQVQHRGMATNRNAQKEKTASIRVLCYNIHHANPPSKPGVIDIDAVAAAIKKQNPDIVALQEVDVFTRRSGSGLNQAEVLSQKTGLQHWFAKAIDHDGGEYGLAILSRYPITATQKYELPTAEGTGGEPRILATATLQLPGNKRLLFACTHLDAQRKDTNRVLQIQKIIDILKVEPLPTIIAGDFNAEPNSTVISLLDHHFTRTCTINCSYTIPVLQPTKTIDFIAFRQKQHFIVKEHKVIDEKYASDHLPVFSVLELK